MRFFQGCVEINKTTNFYNSKSLSCDKSFRQLFRNNLTSIQALEFKKMEMMLYEDLVSKHAKSEYYLIKRGLYLPLISAATE